VKKYLHKSYSSKGKIRCPESCFLFWERPIMRQLLDQWFHPAFASIEEFSELLAATGLVEGRKINRNT